MLNILKVTCSQLAPFLRILAYLFRAVKIVIPILLIILITIDLVRAVISNDDKQLKDATSKSGKRLIYALVIYLVPTIVMMLFNMIGKTNLGSNELGSPTDWISCYKSVR